MKADTTGQEENESGADPILVEEFVQAHHVRWDSRPFVAVRGGAMTKVGFELELRAIHGADDEHVQPGCSVCYELFKGLERLASAVFPEELRPSRYEIGPYDHSWHYSSGPTSPPEVILTIQILHRSEYFDPIDDCEVKCLQEMEQALREIGVREGKRNSAS